MSVTTYIYSLGPNPYGNGDGLHRWGQFKDRFQSCDEALRSLLTGHAFPTILTGRRGGLTFPGISLPYPGTEIIQVWSNEPSALENLRTFETAHPDGKPEYWPHTGDGTNVGLLKEIHVSAIPEYQKPVIAGLLGSGEPVNDQTDIVLSPAGAAAFSFTATRRNEIQLRLLQSTLAGIGTNLHAQGLRDSLRTQMARFGEGLSLLNAYCSGTKGITFLARGDRAPSSDPYSVFQSRVYLAEELGLIANLVDMDHRDMASIDEWLMSSDRWKKLLPHPKCILVSRICRDRREYPHADAFEQMYHNHFNMESLVWVRDGENVWRFATDIQFEERVFPASDDAPQLVRHIQEAIWKNYWGGKRQAEYAERDQLFRSPGDKRPAVDPGEETEPVKIHFKRDIIHRNFADYLTSEQYPPELDLHIQRKAAESIRAHQREMMPFALLLQGIIDHRRILNIPPGTDIFDPVQQGRYIRLVNDFSHGLTDGRYSNQFDRMTKLESLKPGDRIVGWRWGIYTEKYNPNVPHWNIPTKGEGPMIFTVHHIDPHAERSSQKLHVHEFALTKRWVNRWERPDPFTKKVTSSSIDATQWLPADIPLSLAERLLDDRAWKRANRWAVPLLAQWATIRDQIQAMPPRETPVRVELKSPHSR